MHKYGQELCAARFITEKLKDPVQDRRMECWRPPSHQGRHRNETGDLRWDEGAELSITEILRDA